MAIKGLLFDKDGVLVDFERTWAPAMISLADVLSGGDRELTQSYMERAGYDLAAGRFLAGSVWAAGNNRDLAAAWDPDGDERSRAKLEQTVRAHLNKWKQEPVLPLEQMRTLLQDLHDAGFVLGIATNDSESSAHAALTSFGIDQLFSAVYGYDSVEHPKPAAGPVLRFCEDVALAASEVAVIGDNLHDIEMARAGRAGLAIAVLSGNTGRDEFGSRADAILDTIAQLPGYLGLEGDSAMGLTGPD